MNGLVERFDPLIEASVALGERIEPVVDLGQQLLDLLHRLLGRVAAGLLDFLHALGDLALEAAGLLDLPGHPLHDRGDGLFELAHLLDAASHAGLGLAEVLEALGDRFVEVLHFFGQSVHLVGIDAGAGGLRLLLVLLEQTQQAKPLVPRSFERRFELEALSGGGVVASEGVGGVGGVGQGGTSVSDMRGDGCSAGRARPLDG